MFDDRLVILNDVHIRGWGRWTFFSLKDTVEDTMCHSVSYLGNKDTGGEQLLKGTGCLHREFNCLAL